MTPEEIRESLKKHMDNNYRKMTSEEYLSLRHNDEYVKCLIEVTDKKITMDEGVKKMKGSYRTMNDSELYDITRDSEIPKLVAIMKYIFDENNNLKMDNETVQII